MIQQYIQNPQLLDQLTPQQKTQVYQDLQKYLQQLQTHKTKLETELHLKQQEQLSLFKELQEATQLQTLPEIQQFIQSKQQEFDQQLKDIITQLQGVDL
jgi:predicted nuclease with TOPRIM domain